MQTFMPFDTFEASASCLDRQRLGKQRVEAWQLLMNLIGEQFGWIHHPAAKMWYGYEEALCHYGIVCCDTWAARGYVDNMKVRFLALLSDVQSSTYNQPLWMDDEEFHLSHQSNLVRKDPKYYGKLFPGVPDDLPYKWPRGKYTLQV